MTNRLWPRTRRQRDRTLVLLGLLSAVLISALIIILVLWYPAVWEN